MRSFYFLSSLTLIVIGCASSNAPPPAGTAGTPHGKLSELSRVEGDIVLCEHKVPAQVCTKHHPELVRAVSARG